MANFLDPQMIKDYMRQQQWQNISRQLIALGEQQRGRPARLGSALSGGGGINQMLQMQKMQMLMERAEQEKAARESLAQKIGNAGTYIPSGEVEPHNTMMNVLVPPSGVLGGEAQVNSLAPDFARLGQYKEAMSALEGSDLSDVFGDINPSTYTPESIQAFQASGGKDYGVLRKLPTKPTISEFGVGDGMKQKGYLDKDNKVHLLGKPYKTNPNKKESDYEFYVRKGIPEKLALGLASGSITEVDDGYGTTVVIDLNTKKVYGTLTDGVWKPADDTKPTGAPSALEHRIRSHLPK